MQPPNLDDLKRAIDATSYLTRGAAITEEDLRAFEDEHGCSLPPAYRRALLVLGDGVESDALTFCGRELATELMTSLQTPCPYDRAYRDDILGALQGGATFLQLMENPVLRARQVKGTPTGCLPIGDSGGGSYSVLVVTGELRGEVWRTGDFDVPETTALYTSARDFLPISFDTWLACWVIDNGIKL